jgi:surface protein
LGPFTWTVDDTSVSVNAATDFTANSNTLTYTATGLPAGVTIASNGAISGTPTAASSGTIIITAEDEYGRETTSTASHTTALRTAATAADGLGPFSFTLDEAITPVAVSSDFTTNGNTLTYTISPALPAGLSLAANGTLSGTPTALSASSSYTVTGQDEYGRETDSTFSLAVVEDTGFGDDFVLVMETTTASETVTIPCQNNGTFNATIDWGDGSTTSTITAWNDADLVHVYASAGDHTIRISGTFPNIYFNGGGDKLKLKKVLNWGDTGLTRINNAFAGCSNLTEVTSNGNTNTSAITNFNLLFNACTALASVDVSGFNTSNATSFRSLFFGCSSLTDIDVSAFDTSSCTDFSSMFRSSTSLENVDVSGFDTSSATNLSVFGAGMFQNCTALNPIDISDWNITSLLDAANLLSGANSALTTAEYDATLVAWEAQAYNNNVPVHFGDATYTSGSAAATARAQLVTDGWTITDGGPV